MADLHHTIFAKASGAGQAAIAVIRIAGPATASVVGRIAGSLPEPRVASVRRLRDPASGETLDRGLVLWFPGPRSFTGQDSAEFQVHGGAAVIAGFANALVGLGCRPAEPGEFTRRAFLHGKLDLTQAEGIADLIASETKIQRLQALRQAEGALASLYAEWTDRAMRILAHQEAAIEFDMDDLPTDLPERARAAAAALALDMKRHLADSRRGERLREGLTIAVAGAPNAGKSSLLNALVERDVAIVSSTPGTTRDVVEVRFNLAGVPAILADTAGLREAADDIEREGIRRARAAVGNADIVLAVFGADARPDEATRRLLADRPDAVIVLAKCDLADAGAHGLGDTALATSAVTGEGIARLIERLAAEAERRAGLADAPLLTRARHRAAVAEALDRLAEGADAVAPELAAEAYRGTVLALGRLTGRGGVEQILDIVFGDFCIGK
jgi:tRNA modification GTPase